MYNKSHEVNELLEYCNLQAKKEWLMEKRSNTDNQERQDELRRQIDLVCHAMNELLAD